MNSITFKFIKALIAFVVLLIAFLLLGSLTQAKGLEQAVIRKLVLTGPQREPDQNVFKSDISQKNILGLERPTPFSLPTAKRGLPLSASIATIDTVNVLALKVEFQPEQPDDPKTTGNGTFDMRTYDQFLADEGHYIDPAPHNTSFFAAHLEALRRYWSYASDGKLEITGDVFPQDEGATFRLPHKMSWYGSEGPWADSSIGDKLGHFLIDAITFADSTMPEIDFSRYQAIIVFHAGSDQQNNIAFINDTPDDFFTGFLRLAEPIVVDGGTTTVQEGTLMPETVSQDNRVNALNGVMAHEFGHQLGLPDLYNTSNFMTQVGDFSLMDDNGMSVGVEFPDINSTVGGTVPVLPDAWSRAYLGFDVPRVITQGTAQSLSAAYLPYSDEEIIKVPITDFEYFLMENREQDPIHGAFLMGDATTGVILGLGTEIDGERVPIGDYDILLPSMGALIWHIDESVAYSDTLGYGNNNFYNNTLQWNPSRRFLSLVEADGAIDFGGNYYRGYGDDNDFWKAPRFTAFTPYTDPSSHTNLGADSHISITNISGLDTIMTADVNIDWLMNGWPQMSRPGAASDPVIAQLGGGPSNQVLVAAGNQLLIWNADGSKFINNTDSVGLMRFDSTIAMYPLAVAAETDGNIIGRPLALDIDGDGANEIAVLTASGNLYAYRAFDDDNDGRADAVQGFPISVETPNFPPIAVKFVSGVGEQALIFDNNGNAHLVYKDQSAVVVDTTIFSYGRQITDVSAYTISGKNIVDLLQIQSGVAKIVRFMADSGSLDFTQSFEITLDATPAARMASADFDRDGGLPEIVVSFPGAIKLIAPDGAVMWSANIGSNLGAPAIGDINSDGYPKIVVAGDSKIYAFNHTGALLENFPINLGLYDLNGVISSTPVLGDVNNDGKPDIVVGLPSGAIYAFNYHADRIAGFPLPTSFPVSRACALGDVDNNGTLDMITVENSGFVKAWNLSTPYVESNVPWPCAGGNIQNSNYLAPIFEKPVTVADAQLPEQSVYNYPNPAKNSTAIRYYLNSDSRVKINIYDLMGDCVHSVTVSGQAHAANEYVWNCADVASGVYYCRVEADSGSDKVWRLFKIAIVK